MLELFFSLAKIAPSFKYSFKLHPPQRQNVMRNNLTQAHKSHLAHIVGDKYALDDQENLLKYGQDWSRLFTASASLVIRPANTTEVSEVVKYANENQLSIVPSGGRTGLSGGAVATNNEIVLSLERFRY